jgi:hypothetical protein
LNPPCSIFFICSAVGDILLAGLLLFCFSQLKKAYSATLSIQVLAYRAIASGCATSIHATLVLILYRTLPGTNHYIGCAQSLATVYGASLLCP